MMLALGSYFSFGNLFPARICWPSTIIPRAECLTRKYFQSYAYLAPSQAFAVSIYHKTSIFRGGLVICPIVRCGRRTFMMSDYTRVFGIYRPNTQTHHTLLIEGYIFIVCIFHFSDCRLLCKYDPNRASPIVSVVQVCVFV